MGGATVELSAPSGVVLFTFDYFHGRYVPGFCGKDFGIFYRQTGFVEDLFNIDDGLVGIFERLKGFSRD